MKIYYKIGDTEIGKEDFAQDLNYIFGNGAQEAKYKITTLFNNLLRPENEKEKKISLITAFVL